MNFAAFHAFDDNTLLIARCCLKVDGLSLPLYVLPYYPYSSGSQHFFGFALGICKLCLTTINNLSEPVRKLDGQVMKITYDIVDE